MQPSGPLAALCFVSVLAACAGPPATLPPVAANDPPPAPASALASPQPALSTPSEESLTIAFDGPNATLSNAANTQLDGAARLYRDAQPEVMIISGHSDKSGREFENVILSARRAAAVKEALVDRGIPAERLQIVAVGEAEPVPSVPASRIAVVTWR